MEIELEMIAEKFNLQISSKKMGVKPRAVMIKYNHSAFDNLISSKLFKFRLVTKKFEKAD